MSAAPGPGTEGERQGSLAALGTQGCVDRQEEETFTFGGETSSRAIGRRLAQQGIAISNGNNYALEVVRRLGLEEAGGRPGLVHYDTVAESNRLRDARVSL